MAYRIRPVEAGDEQWVTELTTKWWAGPDVITKGVVHHTNKLPGFIAAEGKKLQGLITYEITGAECEVVTMNSLKESKGIGQALLDAVKDEAGRRGCKRLWLFTTNDNIRALKFYQRYGFTIAGINLNVMAKERLLKPEIPLTGNYGIPIRDEIELEIELGK